MVPESHELPNAPRPETHPRPPTLGLFLVGRVRLRRRSAVGGNPPLSAGLRTDLPYYPLMQASESPPILLSEVKNTQNEPIFTPCTGWSTPPRRGCGEC